MNFRWMGAILMIAALSNGAAQATQQSPVISGVEAGLVQFAGSLATPNSVAGPGRRATDEVSNTVKGAGKDSH
jgi:hypothetical protein